MNHPRLLIGRGALGTFAVTTTSGHRLVCRVQTVGRTNPQRRWLFNDAVAQYVGPPFFPIDSLGELVDLVEGWWASKVALGQAGMDVAILRERLAC